MANTSLQTLVVKSPSRFGFVGANGKMYGISKYGKEAGVTTETFVAGQEYIMKIYTSESGKEYVTAMPKPVIGNTSAIIPSSVTGPADTVKEVFNRPQYEKAAVTAAAATHWGKPLSAYDLETGVRMHVSGLAQALISSPLFTLIPNISDPEVYAKSLEDFTRASLDVAQKLVKERIG